MGAPRDPEPNSAVELAAALTDLEARCTRLEVPQPRVVERLLTALGAYLLEGNLHGVEALLDRIRATTSGCRDAFEDAASDALVGATRRHLERCAELQNGVRSSDALMSLDAGREQLEGLRMGASALGCELEPGAADDLERADRILELWLSGS